MAQLTNGNTGGANPTNTQGPPQQKLVETISLQDLITEATDTQINGDINNQEKQDVTQTTDTTPTGTPTTPTGTADHATGHADTRRPTPIQVNARVLIAREYPTLPTAPSFGIRQKGILGGDNRPEVNADDFIWTFNLGPDRLQATITGLVDGSNDFQPATIDFPANAPMPGRRLPDQPSRQRHDQPGRADNDNTLVFLSSSRTSSLTTSSTRPI